MRRFVSVAVAGALALLVSAPLTGVASGQGYVGTGTVTSLGVEPTTVPEEEVKFVDPPPPILIPFADRSAISIIIASEKAVTPS